MVVTGQNVFINVLDEEHRTHPTTTAIDPEATNQCASFRSTGAGSIDCTQPSRRTGRAGLFITDS
jgi:hypothetical protein